MKNVFVEIAFVALLLLSFACKQKPDGTDGSGAVEKFVITFLVEDNVGGSLTAKVDGVRINSGTEVEKGKTVIFTAKADEKNGFRVKGWIGLEESFENAETAILVVSTKTEVRVSFLNIFPEDFVLVPVVESGIEGVEVDYTLPDTDDSWKGVFIKNRTVKLNSFIIAKQEVTYKLWKEVYDWAVSSGYVFANVGQKGGAHVYRENNHFEEEPVTMINWRDAVVWCNAYTEMKNNSDAECVYWRHDKVSIIKNAKEKVKDQFVCDFVYADIDKKGFRLPTEAEWEYSARYENEIGRNVDKYENSYLTKLNSLSGAKKVAGFEGATLPSNETWITLRDEASLVAVYDEWWDGDTSQMKDQDNPTKKTSIVRSKKPNALGLYDMSGNVYEWCFDWYGKINSEVVTDPKGATSGFLRVARGGAWISDAGDCCVGNRYSNPPSSGNNRLGFRLACSVR